MDATSSISSDPLYSLTGVSAPSVAASSGASSDSSSSSSDSVGPAVSLELSTLQQQGQMMSTLFGALDAQTAAQSSVFTGGSMLSLLNAQGSAALKYLSPQAPPPGQTVNATA